MLSLVQVQVRRVLEGSTPLEAVFWPTVNVSLGFRRFGLLSGFRWILRIRVFFSVRKFSTLETEDLPFELRNLFHRILVVL